MWVDYGRSLHALDAAELERQYMAVSSEHAAAPTSRTAVELALLLADPRTPFFDLERALDLLDGVIAGDADDVNVPFASFLRTFIAESSMARTQLSTERERSQALQAQLDALKALEERLNADDLDR